ncbi:MAG: hypothetical protein ACOYEV_10620 [Candidatus Nanopelagicales bacterium]
MSLSVRNPLMAGFAAAVVAAGTLAVAPEVVSSTPSPVTTTVTLAAIGEWCGSACLDTVGYLFHPATSVGALFDPTTSVVYAPADEWATGSVSHPLGLIPQLIGDAMNPPILGAIRGLQIGEVEAVAPLVSADLAAFLKSANGAAAVVGQQVSIAVRDTVTPAQWGGGKVRTDWANVGIALQAMTIGLGATVDGTWVPSLRIAAISTRNQIANDIAGANSTSIAESTLPNYMAHYTPVGCQWHGSSVNMDCGIAEPAASKPANMTMATARSAARVTAKATATATPKASAARTRVAK